MSSTLSKLRVLAALAFVFVAGTQKYQTNMEEDAIDIRAQEGQRVRLHCSVTDVPLFPVYWIFDKGPNSEYIQVYNPDLEKHLDHVDHGKERFKLRNTEYLHTIECLTENSEGVYTCSSESDHRPGKSIEKFDVRMDRKASNEDFKNDCFSRVLVPRIYMHTSRVIDYDGENVLLQCRARGTPMPKIVWFDPRGRLIAHRQEGYKRFAIGDLLIKNLQWERNLGLYKCVAINKRGQDEAETFVYPALLKAPPKARRSP